MSRLPKTAERRRKRPSSKHLVSRIYLFLMDGEEHLFDEFYDFVAEYIPSNIASRGVLKTNAIFGSAELGEIVTEGRRKSILSALRREENLGRLKIIRPMPEKARGSKSKGYTDPKKCILQLTEVGHNHMLNTCGAFTSMTTQLYQALCVKRVKIKVEYLGNPTIWESVEENSTELVVTGNEQTQI